MLDILIPVGKIAEKSVCWSVFLTTGHCILFIQTLKTMAS